MRAIASIFISKNQKWVWIFPKTPPPLPQLHHSTPSYLLYHISPSRQRLFFGGFARKIALYMYMMMCRGRSVGQGVLYVRFQCRATPNCVWNENCWLVCMCVCVGGVYWSKWSDSGGIRSCFGEGTCLMMSACNGKDGKNEYLWEIIKEKHTEKKEQEGFYRLVKRKNSRKNGSFCFDLTK